MPRQIIAKDPSPKHYSMRPVSPQQELNLKHLDYATKSDMGLNPTFASVSPTIKD